MLTKIDMKMVADGSTAMLMSQPLLVHALTTWCAATPIKFICDSAAMRESSLTAVTGVQRGLNQTAGSFGGQNTP